MRSNGQPLKINVESQYSQVNLERLGTTPITRDVAAKLDGVPPVVSLATQISTTRWGNTVSYRSSGPIPTGLYRNVLNGTAAPKPFTQKVKSSNWGVMEGFAVVDDRLGRSEQTPEGFRIRAHGVHDLPKKEGVVTLNKFPLKMVLRDILDETFVSSTKPHAKYELLPANNPDQNGILRFREANHPNPEVSSVVFSINLNDPNAERAQKDDIGLIASPINHSANAGWNKPGYNLPGWRPELGDFTDKLDNSFPCSAQFKGELKPTPIEVYGQEFVTVRDTDLDFITRPTKMDANLNDKANHPSFYQLIDMSHGSVEEQFDASKRMVSMMYKINVTEWRQFNELVKLKKAALGDKFHEEDVADKMPLVPKFKNLSAITQFAITVGLGSPMELYQAMEINIVNQKLLNLAKANPNLNMDDFIDPKTKNAALLKLNKEPLVIDKNIQARFFIQHPPESHNHHYTSTRGASVIINKRAIALAKNDDEVVKYLTSNSKNQFVPINPEWLGDKQGANTHAKEWAKFFVTNFEGERDIDPKINKAVNTFLEKNPQFVEKEIRGHLGDKTKLDNFLKSNPNIKEMVLNSSEIGQDKNEAFKLPPIRRMGLGR